MAEPRNFQGELLDQLDRFFAPLIQVAQEPNPTSVVLSAIGWQVEALTGFPVNDFDNVLKALVTSVQELETLVSSPPQTLSDWTAAASEAATLVSAVSGLSNLVSSGSFPSELLTVGEDIVNLLAVQYLRTWRPAIYRLFIILGIITETTADQLVDDSTGNVQRQPTTIEVLNLSQVSALLKDPSGTLNTLYGTTNGLTDPDTTADTLFPRVTAFLQELNVDAVYGADAGSAPVLGPGGFEVAAHSMVIFKAISTPSATDGGFGAAINLDSQIGVVVKPFGLLGITEALKTWLLTLDAGLTIGGFAINRTGVTLPSASSSTLTFTFTAVKLPPPTVADTPDGPAVLIGSATGTRLQLGGLFIQGQATLSTTSPTFGFSFAADQGMLVIAAGDGDGFLSSVLPGNTTINFDLSGGWANNKGFFLGGGANLTLNIPSALSIGNVIKVSGIQLAIAAGADIEVRASADVAVTIGPVIATVQGLGLSETLTFPSGGGSLGPMDLHLGFRTPDGIGIAIDSGPVSGGGALTFDPTNSRYFGALELSIYSVSVKAFGVIETKLPTGPGYSFLIIISAEFTPIQLGFGFTLNGVGGIIGINRSVDSAGLLTMIKSGQLDNVLFPDDVVDNAPAILNDVETLFPPTKGHYVFGPLAKIGWGTPTLVDGELGLIIEYPGPVLTVIGTVHAALPTQDEALVELNLDVGGVLDFPNKTFSLDASLHDSHVGDFPITGDMAMRMNWGQNPNFAISIGGFNPHYNPPATFPKLKPVTIDLGVNGNPSVTLQGYMALTSNTAQVGAQLKASASKDGAHLTGYLGFDALFVFSPFSFQADIDAGVHVDFHGVGFTLQFHGTIAGPSPWTLNGQVCVSLLFADACVGFSLKLGGTSKPTLPGLDPWVGSPPKADGTQDVPGLQPAIANVANWRGNPPAGSFASVTLVAPPAGTSTSTSTPIDPLGSATLRQKAVPLDLLISSFAGTRPTPQRNFDVTSVQIGTTGQAGSTTVNEPTRVRDYFAPAQFQQMRDAQKLSSQSFVQLDAGITISSDALTFGTPVPHGLVYTDVTFAAPVGSPPTITQDAFPPTANHVTTVTGRSATAIGGLRNSAMAAFVDPTAGALVTLRDELYSIANIANLAAAVGFPAGVPRPVATSSIDVVVTTNATIRQTVQVAPTFFLASSSFVL